MIKRYSDHAANERTFLAWVRTAIAVMAFGFLIERFDLILAAVDIRLRPTPQAVTTEAARPAAKFSVERSGRLLRRGPLKKLLDY